MALISFVFFLSGLKIYFEKIKNKKKTCTGIFPKIQVPVLTEHGSEIFILIGHQNFGFHRKLSPFLI